MDAVSRQDFGFDPVNLSAQTLYILLMMGGHQNCHPFLFIQQQGSAAQPVDAVSRNIQNEISEVQRQKQGLSSKREMPADERSQKQQELQIS
mgnify:CR=1 FL=1